MAVNSRLHGGIFATDPNYTTNHKGTVAACLLLHVTI